MQTDKIRIKSCSSKHVELEGSMLDPSDYQPGSVFVIDVMDWERNCAAPQVQKGLPADDDVLFFKIKSLDNISENKISFAITRISGQSVVPEVVLDVEEGQGTRTPNGVPGEVEIFGDDQAASAARQAISLPTLFRPQDLSKNTTLTTGVSLDFNAGVSASISSFRLVRLIGLRFSWIQRLTAEASATFSVTRELEATRTGLLLQAPVPGFGFRTPRIPFVGRASAGAFVRVDWVLELNAQTTVTAEFDIRREVRRKVEARIFPPSLSTKPLSPLSPNQQSSSLEFGAVAEASVNGFAGVRPALGVEVALGSKSAGGNIGLKIGLELDTAIKTPPFQPLTSGGAKLGVCDQCHALRGELNIRIKDLSLQLERNGKVTSDIVLVANILDLNIAAVCAIPKPCFVSTITPPTAIPLPTARPSPKRTGSCKRCRSDRDCPLRHKCRRSSSSLRVCHLQLSPGQICGGKCTDCPK